MRWRTLQRAGSRLVSTLVSQASGRRDESRRGTHECVRPVVAVTVFCVSNRYRRQGVTTMQIRHMVLWTACAALAAAADPAGQAVEQAERN